MLFLSFKYKSKLADLYTRQSTLRRWQGKETHTGRVNILYNLIGQTKGNVPTLRKICVRKIAGQTSHDVLTNL